MNPTFKPLANADSPHDLHVLVLGAQLGQGLVQAAPSAGSSLPTPPLSTPHLAALLQGAQWSPVHSLGEDSTWSVPDWVHVHALGLSPGALGDAWPDAAWHSEAEGVQAWVTPCHWHMAQGRTLMLDPHSLALDEARSRDFMQAMQPYFEEDGLHLDWHDALHWRLSGAALKAWSGHGLRSIIGRDVQQVMQDQPWPAPLGRLQIEMQMLLYTHALNDVQSQQGLPTVNSFWVHGVGAWPQDHARRRDAVITLDVLEHAWRQGQGQAWLSAWTALDAQLSSLITQGLQSGQRVQVHLCGPTRWQSALLTPQALKPSWWSRLWPKANAQARLNRRMQAL